MTLALARGLLDVFAIYLAIGVAVSLPLAMFGLGRIDAGAKAVPAMFRVLVLPGLIAMWPLFVLRLSKAGTAR